MSDLISRQAAIDALMAILDRPNHAEFLYTDEICKALEQLPSAQPEQFEWCTDCKEYDQERHCCPRWTKVIRNTVAELKAEQRWIPVAERLPEEIDDYLVTVKDRHGDNYVMIKGFFPNEELWFDVPNNGIVTAWMELPKGYEVEE
jgi:hypothetical protein